MLLRCCSDLHLEFLGDYHSHCADNGRDWNTEKILPIMENEKEQVLVLAGDITMFKYLNLHEPFYRDISERFEKVIVICGNHEFYRYNFLDGYHNYRIFLKKFHNIHLLQDETFLTDTHEIFGATLWTDFNDDPNAMIYATRAMSDFKVIEYGDREDPNFDMWTPEQSVKEHKKSLGLLTEFLEAETDKIKIVLTHHLPSPQCGDIRYRGSLLNPAFYSNLDKFIMKHSPALWFFGHTHSSSDFNIGATRLVCNPRGYHNGAENPRWI